MIECLFCLAISPYFSTYDQSIVSEPGIHIAIGSPVYLWASYEEPSYRIVGQSLGDLSIPGAGIGLRSKGKVSFFVEYGHFWTGDRWESVVEQEIARTVLVQDHGDQDWHHSALNRHYSLGNGWGGRIGASVRLSERLSAFAAYRVLGVAERVDMCSGGVTAEDCWDNPPYWQNRDKKSLSSVQIGLTFKLGKFRSY